jgi:LacI family transcriptional regulator, repressor for deo operon, udp, cdd, tsx, nupC, and nupG
LRVTITDIARLAGVTHGTVSRVLNKVPIRISENKRREILAVAEQLNYIPSRSARTLKTGKSNLLAVIAYDITDAFAVECISAIDTYLANTPYRAQWISCAHTGRERAEKIKLLYEITQSVDGVIVIAADHFFRDDILIKYQTLTNLPMVTIIRSVPGGAISSVTIDERIGTELLVRHLADLGHRKAAFCYHKYLPPAAVKRHELFMESAKNHGLEIPSKWDIPVDGTPKDGIRAGKFFSRSVKRPTAVVAFNDLTATGIIKAFFEAGLPIPRQVSIASFDNIRMAEVTTPSLTTVGADYSELARTAVDEVIHLLENKSAGPSPITHHLLKPSLVVRESTASPPV